MVKNGRDMMLVQHASGEWRHEEPIAKRPITSQYPGSTMTHFPFHSSSFRLLNELRVNGDGGKEKEHKAENSKWPCHTTATPSAKSRGTTF
jgi:hypothetical protein